MAKPAWYSLFAEDLSPEVSFFASIAKDWETVDTNLPIIELEKDIPGREEALEFLRMIVDLKGKRNQYIIRDDYRKLAETAIAFLGEKPPG